MRVFMTPFFLLFYKAKKVPVMITLYTVEDALSHYGPENCSDPNIMVIIPRTQQINRYAFGVNLGLDHEDVLTLKKTEGHEDFMVQTFDLWSRKIVEPCKKTWRCILTALKKAGYESLAIEIEKKLCT